MKRVCVTDLIFHHRKKSPRPEEYPQKIHKTRNQKTLRTGYHSQLQQGQVSIAVKCPLFTLLSDIILEYCRCLRVVSVEAAEDGFDVSRPGLALVESDTHFIIIDYWLSFLSNCLYERSEECEGGEEERRRKRWSFVCGRMDECRSFFLVGFFDCCVPVGTEPNG